jgi:hypothetical protein
VGANETMSEAFQTRAIAWVRQYYGQEARSIVDKLRARRRKPPECGEPVVATVGSSMRVAFQALMSDSEEERNAEISREVDSVKVSEVPRRKKPLGLRVADIDTEMSVPDRPSMTTSTRDQVGTSVEVGEPPGVGTRGERHRGASVEVGEPAGFETSGARSESVVEAVAVKTLNVPAVQLPFGDVERQLWKGVLLTLLEVSWRAVIAVQGVCVVAGILVSSCYGLRLRMLDGRLLETNVLPDQMGDQEWSELKGRGEVERPVVDRAGLERVSVKHADVERVKGAVLSPPVTVSATVVPAKTVVGALPVVCMALDVVRGTLLVIVPCAAMMKRRLVEVDERKSGRIVTVLRQAMV